MTDRNLGLTKNQARSVALVAMFVSVIGGLILAFWFRRQNKIKERAPCYE